VYVLDSHWEGLVVDVMESLELVLPVVDTAVGGVPEVVEHGRQGLLLPPRRPSELATNLLTLLNDGDACRRMAAAAELRGTELSIDTAVRRTEAVYRELATAAPGR
jgi:glycosyltransferase involved in cell wall biosynthesis